MKALFIGFGRGGVVGFVWVLYYTHIFIRAKHDVFRYLTQGNWKKEKSLE